VSRGAGDRTTAPLAPARWLRLPTRTARLRLTLLYAGMFLVLGTVLLAATYVLVKHTTHVQVASASSSVAPTRAPGSGQVLIGPLRSTLVAQHNADLGSLLTVMWIVLALTTIGAAVLGWFAAGRVLAPLRSMAGTARTISAGNLHQRLALEGPEDEFKQLGDTLDDLFGRLQSSFEAQRRFVANASHELRTPLTVERALLQVALADPNGDERSLRVACGELLATQNEHEQLLESLLTLASSERGLERREPLDLSDYAAQALQAVAPRLAERGLELDTALRPAQVVGDPALLSRLAANLIENAVTHNVQGGTVSVSTASIDGEASLVVSNTGPAIGAGDVQRLFEPFQRGTGRRADGDGHHGLGLSIVRAIANAHDAQIDARARPGGGLQISVSFGPAAGGAASGASGSY
jgi:signal transduction histidine kinase